MRHGNTGGFPLCSTCAAFMCFARMVRYARAEDRQKINGFLRRCNRLGFCSPGLSSFDDLCLQSDQNMFRKVSIIQTTYYAASSRRSAVLLTSSVLAHITESRALQILISLHVCYFITLIHLCSCFLFFCFYHCATAFWQYANKRICYVMLCSHLHRTEKHHIRVRPRGHRYTLLICPNKLFKSFFILFFIFPLIFFMYNDWYTVFYTTV